MVISRTSAVEVSIQAVSPLSGAQSDAFLIRSIDALTLASSALRPADGAAAGVAGAAAAAAATAGAAAAGGGASGVAVLVCAKAAPPKGRPSMATTKARRASLFAHLNFDMANLSFR